MSSSRPPVAEPRGSRVPALWLCPGAPATEFQKPAGDEDSLLFRPLRPMTAKAVAHHGYRALMKGKPLVISGRRNWLLAESLRISPRRVVTAVSRRLIER